MEEEEGIPDLCHLFKDVLLTDKNLAVDVVLRKDRQVKHSNIL